MPIDVITLDQEKIARTLAAAGVHPKVAEIFIELHETQRALQQLVNELMSHQGKIISALPLMDQLLKAHTKTLGDIERKFSDPHRDLIARDKLDG